MYCVYMWNILELYRLWGFYAVSNEAKSDSMKMCHAKSMHCRKVFVHHTFSKTSLK